MQPRDIKRDSLLAKIFFWWRGQTGFAKEMVDICLVRAVVLFKAPWLWFTSYKITGELRPWMVFLFGILAFLTGKSPVLLLWAGLAAVGLVGFGVYMVVGIIATILLVLLFAGIVMCLIWAWCFCTTSTVRTVLRIVFNYTIGWFFYNRFAPAIYPWTVTWVLIHPALYLFIRDWFWALLSSEATVAIAVVVAILFVWEISDKPLRTHVIKPAAAGTATVLFWFLDSAKRQLCYPVRFVNGEAEPA